MKGGSQPPHTDGEPAPAERFVHVVGLSGTEPIAADSSPKDSDAERRDDRRREKRNRRGHPRFTRDLADERIEPPAHERSLPVEREHW